MKKRPLYLNMMMILHVCLIISFFVQIAWIYNHHLIFDVFIIWDKLTLLNKVLMLLFALSIPLYAKASRLLLLLLPINFYLIFLNNNIVATYGQDFSVWQANSAGFLYILANLYLLSHKNLKIILNPLARWWRCSKRLPLSLPVKLITSNGVVLETKTFEISKTGAFLKTYADELKAGESIKIEIPTPSGLFELQAKIVRKSAPQGHYPAGIGVHFSKLGLGGRLFLEKLTSNSVTLKP